MTNNRLKVFLEFLNFVGRDGFTLFVDFGQGAANWIKDRKAGPRLVLKSDEIDFDPFAAQTCFYELARITTNPPRDKRSCPQLLERPGNVTTFPTGKRTYLLRSMNLVQVK